MKRFAFITIVILAVLSLMLVTAQDDAPGLETEFLFELRLDPAQGPDLGKGSYGPRFMTGITGGAVEGPEINGEVLSGGQDVSFRRSDGVFELDARIIIRTDDGSFIYMAYDGIIFSSPGNDDIYWRITPRFDTGAEEYSWMNRILAVGVRSPSEDQIVYQVYAIK